MTLSVEDSGLVILGSITGGTTFGLAIITVVWAIRNRPINRLEYAAKWLKTAIDYQVPALLKADEAQLVELTRLDTLGVALPFDVRRGSLVHGFAPRVGRWAVLPSTNTRSSPPVYRCFTSVAAAQDLFVGLLPQWLSDEFIQAFDTADRQQRALEDDFRVSISTQRPKSI